MKKIISPVIYALFLLVATALGVGASMLLEQFIEYDFTPAYLGATGAAVLVIGTVVYCYVNKLLKKIEVLQKPSFGDHLRQSVFYYLLALYTVYAWTIKGVSDKDEHGYLLMWLSFSVIAIAANAITLFYSKKK